MQHDPLVLIADGEHRITRLNAAGERLTGYSQHDVIGKVWHELLLPEHERAALLDELEQVTVEAESLPSRRRGHWRASDGSLVLVEWGNGLLLNDTGSVAQVVITGNTVHSESEPSPVGTFEWDVVTNRVTWSDELWEIYGLDRLVEPTYETFLRLVHPEDRVTVVETISNAVANQHSYRVQERIVRPDGEIRYLSSFGEVIADADGNLRIVGTCVDVTEERWIGESRSLPAATALDPLTGLPNRASLLDDLDRVLSLARAQRDNSVAVLFVDLDRFRLINDALGHEAGDDALCAVAARLRTLVRPQDTVARVGTDEFAIVADGGADLPHAHLLGVRLAEGVAAPLRVADRDLLLTASVGVAFAPGGAGDAADLLRDAEAAARDAHRDGGGRCVSFHPAMGDASVASLEAEQRLRLALAGGGLRPVYQPIVRLSDLSLVGLEALARLRTPTHDSLPASEFIPVAERTGLIQRIGREMLAHACADLDAFSDVRGGEDLSVAINLSACELAQPDIVEEVALALDATGLAPERLCIEVTETALMSRPAESVATLRWLRAAGIRLALDDFGTGYSSLAYLRRLPVDIVKIDRSFVAGLGSEEGDETTVAAIISLAHALGLEVVAEGVEDDVQLQIVRRLGADFAQGYLFSRPVEAERVPDLIRAG